MKIQDYINSDYSLLNNTNIWTLTKYEYLIKYLVSQCPQKYSSVNYTVETIHDRSVLREFSNCINKTLLLSNLDIDFPPPKPPFEYDAFFDVKKLPPNYENMSYGTKIDDTVIQLVEKNSNTVFAHAVSISHPQIQMIPAGVFSRFNHFHLKTNPKTILCY